MLVLDGVEAYYGKSCVLRGVSLVVDPNEVVCLLGRNGAGKTTTLRTIMGLTPPRSGSIRFFGREISRLPAHRIPRLGIGYVPQGRHVFPEMTVEENLAIGVLRGRLDGDALEEMYALFPVLKERRRQLGGTLSGGEQQMLAIARVMVTRPKLVIMDEPSEGLSPLFVDKVAEAILEIKARGLGVLLVEQQAALALGISERAYLIMDGAVVHHGRSADLAGDEHTLHQYLGTAVRGPSGSPARSAGQA